MRGRPFRSFADNQQTSEERHSIATFFAGTHKPNVGLGRILNK